MSEQDQFIFTETEIQEGTKELPIDDLLKLADTIWNDIKSDINYNKEEKLSYMTEYYFSKYKDFSYSFPIVIRWMIQLNTYNRKAFKKYLLKFKETKLISRKDFAILQAEYLVLIYKETHSHYKNSDVNTYRDFIVKQLVDEEALHTTVEKEFKQELEAISKEKREQFYQYLLQTKQI